MSENRFCVISGVSGGVGSALASEFRRQGFTVIGLDIREPGATDDVFIKTDLERFARDERYAETLLERIRETVRSGRLSVLINNAAAQILQRTEQISRQAWKQTIDVNLGAPLFLAKGLLPELEAAKGAIINVGSIHARQTKAGFVSYATSKAALAGLTRALAVDLGGRVRVNAIEPAAIATPMLQSGFAAAPEKLQQLNDFHPCGRIARPSEIARMVYLMAADDIGFMHGACVAFDGGIGGRLHDPD